MAMSAAILILCSAAQAEWIGRLHWNGSVSQDYGTADNWSLQAANTGITFKYADDGSDTGVIIPFADGQHYVPANMPYGDPAGDIEGRDIVYPALESDVFIDIDGPGPILNQDITTNVVHMGGAAWIGAGPVMNANMTIQTGNMNVIWWFVIGEQFGSHGTLTMEGGSLNVGTDLMIGAHMGGSGTLNMTGGVITTTNLFTAFDGGGDLSQQFGHINLDGGVINVNAGLFTNDRSIIDITEGQMNIAGDWAQAILDNQVEWGHITAYGGTGKVETYYNQETGMTEITAVVPEPATMIMFGIGAAGLVRRKK